jgi:hypothetical protein
MRTVIKAALALGFVGAMAISASAPSRAQGAYVSGPGVDVRVGDSDWRYRHRYRHYHRYGGDYAYAPGHRRHMCRYGYTVQDGVCKPYRGY